MPIYEYKCENCGHQLEAIQKFSDPPLLECPACGQPTLTKLISAAAFQLKGTGWYVTDFRDKNKKKDGAKPDDKPAAEKPAAGDSTSENKAADQPEKKTEKKASDA
jgi:putative FmdB family regulatory protein